ncbi:hypothetical protein WT83_04885 [Burkholderia territorii]|uniref:Uncharacterized protein n=1 Tax=Burkholderia territorii TaxID=1503055 RepID=A0A108F2W1_9BURK|nr:hypothetical protein [Burkholderia territorii]KWN22010.1 hypothetical protein WT83_04885 [Burkholderia territorii]
MMYPIWLLQLIWGRRRVAGPTRDSVLSWTLVGVGVLGMLACVRAPVRPVGGAVNAAVTLPTAAINRVVQDEHANAACALGRDGVLPPWAVAAAPINAEVDAGAKRAAAFEDAHLPVERPPLPVGGLPSTVILTAMPSMPLAVPRHHTTYAAPETTKVPHALSPRLNRKRHEYARG